MDDRQTQIRERAGLEESRLNVDFIDWLRKWGSPLLLVAALGAGAVWAKEKYTKTKKDNADLAFAQYEQARGSGKDVSPDSLSAVASEFQGTRSVGELARLEAADAYLNGVRRGLKVGAVLKTDDPDGRPGQLENADDVLTPETRADYLTRAGDLYQAVLSTTDANPDKILLALNAMYGLAAVEEGRANFDGARAWYEKIAARTTDTTWDAHAKVAMRRIVRLDTLKNAPVLPSIDAVPQPPKPVPVVAPAPTPTEGGTPLVPVPVTPVTPVPEPTPVPTPAPADAPK